MTIAAGVLLLLAAASLRTRYGRMQFAIWLLRLGTALVDAGTRIIEARR
ncbi:hypothetical protein [Mesorhizobium sp. M4B.F.Ca.ET.013.02.1.1]|nr:hypothetical protein [Mesorhizobium sp. M4B.F.Ca.ET.013.02.1.1]